ncbi:MAG: MBL fold metallo-hydrolase [bacterium]
MRQTARTILLSATLLCIWTQMISSQQTSDRFEVIEGAVNGALIHHNGKTLAVYGDPREKPATVDTVLFTHHRRDVVWAGRELVRNGAKAVVPAREANLFTEADKFWADFQEARFHDYDQQTSKILTEPLEVNKTVSGGETLDWEGIPIQVLDTPGYTRGAVSYLVELDSKRIAFTGDLIYGDGKLIDWYSLQDGVKGAIQGSDLRGYHGYASRGYELIESLRQVAAQQPDLIVPARGPVIHDVSEATARLIQRVQAACKNYLSICALRWYFKDDYIRFMADRILGPEAPIEWMPMAKTLHEKPPDWILPISNRRLLISEDGSGFLIDAGFQDIFDEIKKLMREERIRSLDGIYVTHYHDDHTDQVAALANEYGCPVYACEELCDILENPSAYRLPAMTANPIPGVKAMPEGSTMRWKEFEFTFSYFPGQTILHGGLLVKKDNGEKIFFIGDSFSPSGIDDYCLLNRNLLHPNTGYFYCLDRLLEMKPDYLLINQHIDPPFRFSKKQLAFMRETLEKRVDLLGELFPWDDPNYGLDERWARFYPYEQHAQQGKTILFTLKVMNHSPRPRTFHAEFHGPQDWKAGSPKEITIRPREEGNIRVEVTPPHETSPGLYMITADLHSEDLDFREWTEAMVLITAK